MSQGCDFCDPRNFEGRLIGEAENSWIVATRGQITDGGYVLAIPKRHVSCVAAMAPQEAAGLSRVIERAASVIHIEYGVNPIIFEHGIIGQTIQHAHLHLVPATIWLEDRINRDFPGAEVSMIFSFETLCRIYAAGNKYLFWSDPWDLWRNDLRPLKVLWNPPAPLQYLRTVTAELLGRLERANWRNVDPELDKNLYTDTMIRLKPYFS